MPGLAPPRGFQVRGGRAMPGPLRLVGPRRRPGRGSSAGRRGVAATGAAHAAAAGGALQASTGARLGRSMGDSYGKWPIYRSDWWFGTWFLFSIIYGMSSFPLIFIFFKLVETTNQRWFTCSRWWFSIAILNYQRWNIWGFPKMGVPQ